MSHRETDHSRKIINTSTRISRALTAPWRRRWVWLIAVIALLAGCQPKTPPPQESADAQTAKPEPLADVGPSADAAVKTPDASQAPADVAKPAPEAAPPSGPPLLKSVEALRYLPAETLFVMTGEGGEALMLRFGRQKLEEQTRFNAAFDKLTRGVERLFGYDLLDPQRLREMGVDTEKPFGVAWLSLEDMTFASFVALKDAAAFEEALEALAEKAGWGTLERKTEGDALILSAPQAKDGARVSVVLRGGRAFVLLNDNEALRFSHEIAGVTPEKSLGLVPSFAAAADAFEVGRHTAGVVHMAALRRQLQTLHSTPVGPKEVLLDALAQGVSVVLIGADIEQQMLRTTLQIHHEEDAFIGHVLRNSAGRPLLRHELSHPPLLLLAGQVQPEGMLRFLELSASVMQIDLAMLTASFEQHAGLKLVDDLLPLLSGEAGFALTGELDDMLESMTLDAALNALDVALVLGLSDGAEMTTLLDRLASPTAIMGLFFNKKEDGSFELPIPGWKRLKIKVVGEQLVLTTDDGLLAKVTAGEAGDGFFAKLEHAQLRGLMERQETALFALLDHRWIGGILLLEYRDAPILLPEPSTLDPVPEGYQAQWDALQEIQTALDPLLNKKYQDLEQRALKQLQPLGNLALHMRTTPKTIHFEGGVFFDAESLPMIIESLIELSWDYVTRLRAGISKEDRKLRKLKRKRDKAVVALRALLPPP